MNGDIDHASFEYGGIEVSVRAVWAGWQYDFDYEGVHYFGHYLWSFHAEEGAREKIRQLKSDGNVDANTPAQSG